MTPRVSVIIPAYNVAPFIAEALTSVLAQTCQEWEAIVINDGSPDTRDLEVVLDPFRNRIVYVKQENRGVAAARNAGIGVARGEYLAFLDGDDRWRPGYLASQLACLNARQWDMVYADAGYLGSRALEGRSFMELAPSRGDVTSEALLAGRCQVITSGTVVRRASVAAVGGFREHNLLAEDFDLWLRLARAGVRIGYQRERLLDYRVREGSLSGDAMQQAHRAIQAFEVADALDLTPRERRIVRQRLKRQRAERDLEEVKQQLLLGNYSEARRSLWTLIRSTRSARLAAILAALWVLPDQVRRVLERKATR